jgi:hypothetical protein
MKTISIFFRAIVFCITGLMAISCDRTEVDEDTLPAVQDRTVIEVKASIKENTTWSAKNKYLLNGFVYVESGATLTIEPGTIIRGDKVTKGTLIVKPGAKIIAEGTVERPIVFTSNQAPGMRNYGDWGGIILLGKAPVNKTPATIEGENISTFGGDVSADNSGILKYVRIEFAGIAFETDKEINGLTMGGVGSGTVIDYVQTSFTGDDSYEWFGGTVNAKHLIAYRGLDDDFDTDWGYSGHVQYGLSIRDPKVADQCACSDSNGFESDNDASGSTATPQTSASFANISIFVGEGGADKKYRSALRLRRNTAISVYNSLFVGDWQAKGGLELEGTATQDNYKAGKMKLEGLHFVGMAKPIVSGDETLLKASASKNGFGGTWAELGLLAGYNNLLSKPVFLPGTSAKVLAAGVTLPSVFEQNNIVGAFGTTDWTKDWTNFDPQNTIY